jgi:hypothetical protein
MTAESNGSDQIKKPSGRKRGGQPGNTIAFKHGFYTTNFSLGECRGMQAAKGLVLGDEIALLRVRISEAIRHLASLLRTDHTLGVSAISTFIKQLNVVLADISEQESRNEA